MYINTSYCVYILCGYIEYPLYILCAIPVQTSGNTKIKLKVAEATNITFSKKMHVPKLCLMSFLGNSPRLKPHCSNHSNCFLNIVIAISNIDYLLGSVCKKFIKKI